jgi:hypothetical protein
MQTKKVVNIKKNKETEFKPNTSVQLNSPTSNVYVLTNCKFIINLLYKIQKLNVKIKIKILLHKKIFLNHWVFAIHIFNTDKININIKKYSTFIIYQSLQKQHLVNL